MTTVRDSARQGWLVYVRPLMAGCVLGYAVYLGLGRCYAPPVVFTRTFYARFDWDSSRGFQTFDLMASGHRVGGRFWQYLVRTQAEPALASYLRRGGFHNATGNADVVVARVIPVVFPDSWGSDGLTLDTGVTPLMRAAHKGDLNSVTKLLAGGADVNARDWEERTPLLYGCEARNLSILETLLAAGADVNAHDKSGDTPLLVAATVADAKDQPTIIRELLAAGADVNAKDEDGGTALMDVAAHGNAEAVMLLLQSGADASARTATGMTALSFAEEYKHPEIGQILRKGGAQK